MRNTFGHIFTLTTFGESHGAAIGGVVDGMPAGIDIDLAFIQSELDLLSLGGTEEDAALNKLLSAHFHVYNPADVLIQATYNILREENLFSHRIAKPVVKYYESEESESGQVVLVETSASYVKSTYVSSLN